MQIGTTTINGVHIVTLDGKLDTNASTEFETYLQALVDGGAKRLLIDLDKVVFITSSGLRVLLATAKRIKAIDGDLCVCSLSQAVREVFDISGFSTLLTVFDSQQEAIDAC